MASIKMVPLEEEKRRNPELKDSDIQSLRDWCSKQPHLPEIADSELVLFLHSNYYRLEPTKQTIDTFYTVRTHVPDFFSNRDILEAPDLKQISKVSASVVLDQPTKEGYRIVYGGLLDYNPAKYDYTYSMKLLTMVVDLWLHNEGTMNGHVIIIELKGLVMGHVGRISPVALKKFLYYLQEGLPVRLKSVHFLNSNPVMDIIMNIMKPFMKKELIEIVHLHQKVDAVKQFNIPVEALPAESGGKAGTLQELFDVQMNKLIEHRQWFVEDEKYQRVDESKRPGKAKSASELFGVEGSFKKLDID